MPDTFRCKAEWEPQRSVWLAWPHSLKYWGEHLSALRKFYVELIEMIVQFQPVHLIVPNKELYDEVMALGLGEVGSFPCHIKEIPNNDLWIRDYGPIFVEKDGRMAVVDFEFNAWGEKFPPWDLDNAIPLKISKEGGYEYMKSSVILEGGNLDFNGEGVALTTEPCLLHKNRNPDLSKVQITAELKSKLGLSEIVWLPHGFHHDHTDGHVDNVARFIAKDHVLLVMPQATDVENYRKMQKNLAVLKEYKYRVSFMPFPAEQRHKGEVLPASYANFMFVNRGIIFPMFGCSEEDKAAEETLKELFPDRKILGINCNTLSIQSGGLHCMSKNE